MLALSVKYVKLLLDNCNCSEGSIREVFLACFLPKSRGIQVKMPSPKVIWNAF